MPDITSLNVSLHGKQIGVLTFLPGEQTFFAFSQSYIDHQDRPVLSLSFKNNRGNLITDIRPTRVRVPPFFSNMLPEGPLRDYLAARAGVKGMREFFLLWVLGRDLPGAVIIEPTDKGSLPEESPNKKLRTSRQGMLRFSLAGVQLKFSAVLEASGGLTIPAEGVGGSWVVKLPSFRFQNVPENEYAMMTLARDMGMDIPEVKLVPLKRISGLPAEMSKFKGEALAVRRFDRTSVGPIHMEDFAQVFGVYPEEKYRKASYKNIAEVLWAETGEKGIVEFVSRLVFNTLIGNADLHLKNFSLIYPDRQTAQLSPGYDFVSTIPYLDDGNMALNYVKSKNMGEFSLETLSYLAAKAGLPEKLVLETAKETVGKFRQIWEKERRHLSLPREAIRVIEKHFRKIPLFKELDR